MPQLHHTMSEKKLFILIAKTKQKYMTIDNTIFINNYIKAPEIKGFVMGLEMV